MNEEQVESDVSKLENTMNLQHILNEHNKWLNGEGGERANLRGVDLQYADLRHACLRGANLQDVNLRYANIQYADLSGACLWHANLQGANLRYSNIRHADLWGADLRDVCLHGASLKGANFQHADLRGADLSNADLRDACLWRTVGNMREIKSLQLEQYPITYTATHLQIGCENHTIEQWWKFTEDEIYTMDGQKSVDFWCKYKDVIKQVIETSPAVDTLVK